MRRTPDSWDEATEDRPGAHVMRGILRTHDAPGLRPRDMHGLGHQLQDTTFVKTFILTFGYFLANFERLVLDCIRIRIRSRSVFEKKENLGVCAKQKVRLTRLGKYYVVQYYTLYRCAEKSISLFRLPM